jgi:dTDP-glucose pyrophosphorylase
MNAGGPTVVGLVPVAGVGHRIAPLPCSKELYPIGFRRDEQSGELRAKVASHHVFEKFRTAGITTAYVILRTGKWDIPAYFVDGHVVGVNVAYLVITGSLGPPDTLDRARPFVGDQSVAFGFPDIQFGPDDAFEQLLERLNATKADVVLGLYPAHDSRVMDMVDVDSDGRIRALVLKPRSTELRYTWVCAVWTVVFTQFMHTFVVSEQAKGESARRAYQGMDAQGDLPVGAVMRAAVESGLRVYGLPFPHESYIDIGTPDNLVEAVKRSMTSSTY